MNSILLSNRHLKDINPMECGEEFCRADYCVGPTSRTYYLLHFIFSGKGTLTAQGKKHAVSKGQIFVIHPYEIVHYHADAANPWHYCWVGFELAIEAAVLESSSVLTVPQAEHIFSSLKESDKTGPQKELYICGKIFELLSMLEQPNEKKSVTDQYISQAKQFMDINYMDPISVCKIAEHLNIGRSYFSTLFRKYIGESPQKYLLNLRLRSAAELISQHGYSVSEAAESSGYSDIFNFSKMFKKKFGVSPAYYGRRRKLPSDEGR